MAKITSWSASRFNTYTDCPAKARYKFIDKLQEPPNLAMSRGLALHKLAEDFIGGVGTRLPKELKLHEKLFKLLRAARKKGELVEPEISLSFRKDWSLTVWNDWTGCWLRVKADCISTNKYGDSIVYDWKSGKYRPDDMASYVQQMELYALAVLAAYPDVVTVMPQLIYLDTGDIVADASYTQEDLPGLKKTWLARTNPMLSDQRFAPKPNKYCGYCHFRQSNGGPCNF